MPPSSGRINLGWNIGDKDIGIDVQHRGRTDVVTGERAANRPHVFLDIAIGGAPVGRLVCELFSDVVPRTAENFRSLCTGIRGDGKRGSPLHYRKAPFHRIIPNFMVQGGDITHGDGSGGESIFGQTFPDESLALQHTTPGILSMANSGRDTNNSQFFICSKECPELDGKHVVFGRVIEGMRVLRLMDACGSESGAPTQSVVVDDCGELRSTGKGRTVEGVLGEDGQQTKRRRLCDAGTKVRILQVVKKHAGLQDPIGRGGEPAKCTKGRAQHALASMRKRLELCNSIGEKTRHFMELAREHSDAKTASKGGDDGYVGLGTLPSRIEPVAFSLEIGELSEPLESPEGVHLILRAA